VGRRPPSANACSSGRPERILAVLAERSMSTDGARRWLMLCYQLLGMQRDIAQRQIHGPGSGKAR
jgi:hypothetical protein